MESQSFDWVFATNADLPIPISLQPNVVNLEYLKLWILLELAGNIKGLTCQVAKIKGLEILSLRQWLNSFYYWYLLKN